MKDSRLERCHAMVIGAKIDEWHERNLAKLMYTEYIGWNEFQGYHEDVLLTLKNHMKLSDGEFDIWTQDLYSQLDGVDDYHQSMLIIVSSIFQMGVRK